MFWLWLWDSDGPADHSGVTDDESRALHHAETLLTEHQAGSVRVEAAILRTGGYLMNSGGYERTGSGWNAVVGDDGAIRLTHFTPAAAA